MKHIYRISLIGGLWRLMRDDCLHSTYRTQGAAKAGMATEQAREEQREIKGFAPLATDELVKARRCGQCDVPCAPIGIDWPYWIDGKPACYTCAYARAYAARKGE